MRTRNNVRIQKDGVGIQSDQENPSSPSSDIGKLGLRPTVRPSTLEYLKVIFLKLERCLLIRGLWVIVPGSIVFSEDNESFQTTGKNGLLSISSPTLSGHCF